jgi:hypothetical protein
MAALLPCGCRVGFTICPECTPELLMKSTEAIPELELHDPSDPSDEINRKIRTQLRTFEYPSELRKVALTIEEIRDIIVQRHRDLSQFHQYQNAKYSIKAHIRYVLIEWLIDVYIKMLLNSETIVRAVHLFDLFTSIHQVPIREVQVTGAACLLIASKLHEVYPIHSDNLTILSDGDFNIKQLNERELLILQGLKWNLYQPTSYDFYFAWLTLMLQSGFMKHSEQNLGHYLLLLSLLNNRFMYLTPNNNAAAVLYLTISESRHVPEREFEQLTQVTVASIVKLVKYLSKDHVDQTERAQDQRLSIRLVYEMKN